MSSKHQQRPSQIEVNIRDGVACVRLANERRRNAINLAMVDEVAETLDRLEADPAVSVVVFTGEGSAFCAGADLRHLARASEASEEAAAAVRAIYRLFIRVENCRLPTIAAVNGPAVGAGLNLALACDIRLAGESARFATRFLSIGLHPGGGHTWMMRRAVGQQTAMVTVLADEELTGADAARVGLVWRCVPDHRLLDESVALAARVASAPRQVLIDTKESIKDMAAVSTYPDAVEYELPKQLHAAQQDAFRDRMSALAGVAAPKR